MFLLLILSYDVQGAIIQSLLFALAQSCSTFVLSGAMIIGAYVYTSDPDAIYYADVNEIFRYGEREGGREGGREGKGEEGGEGERKRERERGSEGEGKEGGREGEGEGGKMEGGREMWILLDSRS